MHRPSDIVTRRRRYWGIETSPLGVAAEEVVYRVESALLVAQPTLDRLEPLRDPRLAEPHLGDVLLGSPARGRRCVRVFGETEVHQRAAPRTRAATGASEWVRGLHLEHDRRTV